MRFEDFVDGLVDLLFVEAELDGSMDRGGGEVAELLAAFIERAAAVGLEDSHSLAADSFDYPLRFEAGVGLADRHGVNLGRFGDVANAGEHIAGSKPPAGDQGVNLIDELPIDRHARRWMELEKDRPTGHVYQCSDAHMYCKLKIGGRRVNLLGPRD